MKVYSLYRHKLNNLVTNICNATELNTNKADILG